MKNRVSDYPIVNSILADSL